MSDEVEALIHPGDDGKFWAEVVGLSGCYAQGDNYSKILAALRDAHELCSGVIPGGALIPAAEPVELPEGMTVGQLIANLGEAGWVRSPHRSAAHQLIQQEPGGAYLCVPLDEALEINSGFRAAVAGYLNGSR